MIDPKLNEIPVKGPLAGTRVDSESEPVAERSRVGREGLSINDTIAGDANLSVGSRGVDTSGLRAGAGAGAGSTSLTATEGSSPAPSIVPGARQTGTTPAAAAASGQSPIGRRETGVPGTGRPELSEAGDSVLEDSSSASTYSAKTYADDDIDYSAISTRAYECWCERGCPEGSPEIDWHRAESEVRERRAGTRTSAATA